MLSLERLFKLVNLQPFTFEIGVKTCVGDTNQISNMYLNDTRPVDFICLINLNPKRENGAPEVLFSTIMTLLRPV